MDKTAKFLHIAPSIQTNTDALEVVNHTHTHTQRPAPQAERTKRIGHTMGEVWR